MFIFSAIRNWLKRYWQCLIWRNEFKPILPFDALKITNYIIELPVNAYRKTWKTITVHNVIIGLFFFCLAPFAVLFVSAVIYFWERLKNIEFFPTIQQWRIKGSLAHVLLGLGFQAESVECIWKSRNNSSVFFFIKFSSKRERKKNRIFIQFLP